MEKKERYSYWQGTFAVVDNKTGKRYDYVVDLLNQQDKEINRFMLMKNREQLVGENEALKDTIAVILAQKRNLSKLYRQLKDQLSNEEKSHDLCIKDFEIKTEKLRKQIKSESDARERFKVENQRLKKEVNDWKQRFISSEKRNETLLQNSVCVSELKNDKIKQLKQSQKQLAISELEKIYNLFEPYENSQKDTILCANNGISFVDYLENQIKSLKGEE